MYSDVVSTVEGVILSATAFNSFQTVSTSPITTESTYWAASCGINDAWIPPITVFDPLFLKTLPKEEFRNGIFVHKASALERKKKFGFEDYAPLKEAIQKKLMTDLKNVVNLSIATSTNTNPKAKKHRDRAFETLLGEGYCDSCAEVLLKFVGEILRKQ